MEQAAAAPVRPSQSLADIQKSGFRVYCFKCNKDIHLPQAAVSVRQFLQGKIRVSGECKESGNKVSCFLKQEVWNEAVKNPNVCRQIFSNYDDAARLVGILQKPENAKAATAMYFYNQGDRQDEALLAGLSDVDELKKLFSKKEKPQKKRKAESDVVVEKEGNAVPGQN